MFLSEHERLEHPYRIFKFWIHAIHGERWSDKPHDPPVEIRFIRTTKPDKIRSITGGDFQMSAHSI